MSFLVQILASCIFLFFFILQNSVGMKNFHPYPHFGIGANLVRVRFKNFFYIKTIYVLLPILAFSISETKKKVTGYYKAIEEKNTFFELFNKSPKKALRVYSAEHLCKLFGVEKETGRAFKRLDFYLMSYDLLKNKLLDYRKYKYYLVFIAPFTIIILLTSLYLWMNRI